MTEMSRDPAALCARLFAMLTATHSAGKVEATVAGLLT
jgi:hypothetical protein